MSAKPSAIYTARSGQHPLTLAVLQQQNDFFRGSGGVSEENRSLGFKPAFYDMDTGTVYPSRFANGMEAPMHLLDGLPDQLVLTRAQNGRVTAVKPGVIAGFVRHGQFYTRDQAARSTRELKDRSSLLANPEAHRPLLDVWETFINDQECSSPLIRPVVEESWRRCRDSSVDPLIYKAPLSEPDELERRRYESSELVSAAQPVLKRAGELLFRADSLILLADENGLILNLEADQKVRSTAHRVNLTEGGQWGEAAVGTNAIGTAIAAGEPVQLYGAEHFCSGIKRYTCSADVIRDPHDGRILGAIDLSGLTDAYQRDALEFARQAARLVEANLAQAYFRDRTRVIEATRSQFRNWVNVGLLAFDRRGRLVKANLPAHRTMQELKADLQLTPQSRVDALDLERVGTVPTIPLWLCGQTRYPIRWRNSVLGTLVVLALQH